MTKEEKQAQLATNYKRYQEEHERLLSEGKHIGTFSVWQFKNKLVNITIPMSREEFFGQPKKET